MKVLIAGRPGVGKSYITLALAERGYPAYDLEEVPGVIRLEDKVSGQPVEWPDDYIDWEKYAWRIQAHPLHDFLATHAEPLLFVSGPANNQTDFYALFDLVIVLTLKDPAELRHRLETRGVHEYGQSQANIDRAVERFLRKNAELLTHGGLPVDNSRPVDEVVNAVLRVCHEG